MTHSDVALAIARLDRDALAAERWFGGHGRSIVSIGIDDAFVLDETGPHVLAILRVDLDDRSVRRYSVALTGAPLRVAGGSDGTWRALAAAMAEGRTIPAVPAAPATPVDGDPAARPRAVLVCRPARGMVPSLGSLRSLDERALGADQSNTSVVLGERILVKVFRRLRPGLNPELELGAYLGEEAAFEAVPALAGYAELVSSANGTETVALAQAFIADGADAYEAIAEALTARILGLPTAGTDRATGRTRGATPAAAVDLGSGAAGIAADLGSLTAGMHAALASARGMTEMEPRPASRAESRAWERAARAGLAQALDVADRDGSRLLRELTPRISDAFDAFGAATTPPLLTRIHGDYHLGQVLISPGGLRIVDLEGDPLRTIEERRALDSPLRDVASMLRSLDHVGRSAGRRATARNGGPVEAPGLDLAAWLRDAREQFLAAYRVGLTGSGTGIVLDPTLLRAFELDKECREFVYAATYLPSWSWAPTEGMRGLFADDPGARS